MSVTRAVSHPTMLCGAVYVYRRCKSHGFCGKSSVEDFWLQSFARRDGLEVAGVCTCARRMTLLSERDRGEQVVHHCVRRCL